MTEEVKVIGDKKSIVSHDNFLRTKIAEKKYGQELIGLMEETLEVDEQRIYETMVNAIAGKNKLVDPEDLMLLDNAVYDFLRIKRIQKILLNEGDIIINEKDDGSKTYRANPASALLNSVEMQFRATMKDLMLTRKEKTKKSIGADAKDFSTWVADVIDVQ